MVFPNIVHCLRRRLRRPLGIAPDLVAPGNEPCLEDRAHLSWVLFQATVESVHMLREYYKLIEQL